MQSSKLFITIQEKNMTAHCNILSLYVGYESLSQTLWMAILLFSLIFWIHGGLCGLCAWQKVKYNSSLIFILFIYLFLRKISPELTTTNPPLFSEEGWPRGKIRAHLPPLSMWDAYHSMACQVVPCPHPGSEPANPRPLRSGTCELNRCAIRPAPLWCSIHLSDLLSNIPWP